VAEVCKILLGAGELLHHRKLAINLLEVEFESIDMKNGLPLKVAQTSLVISPTIPDTTDPNERYPCHRQCLSAAIFRMVLRLLLKTVRFQRMFFPVAENQNWYTINQTNV